MFMQIIYQEAEFIKYIKDTRRVFKVNHIYCGEVTLVSLTARIFWYIFFVRRCIRVHLVLLV